MHNLEDRRERFLLYEMPRRLGAIAANLARLHSFASNPANRQAILDLLEESRWFIEWAAPSAETDVAARLVEIQVSLTLLESRLRGGAVDVGSVSSDFAAWRDEILDMSHLLA